MSPKKIASVGQAAWQAVDFAVANLAVFLFRLDLGGVDALHAVGAFFHHAAAAHRDIGVLLQLRGSRVSKIGVLEEIEPAHFVRAIVGAIAGADAAVVNHVVQPLGLWLVAPTGQTTSQGAFSQCMHGTG